MWNVGMEGILDNREYFNQYTDHQTIFGSRVFLSGGLSINEHHQLVGGIDYFYEFGTLEDYHTPKMILYYKGHKDPLTFYFGSFHRKNLLNYPLVLLSDTLNYFRPNIEGIYLCYSKSRINQNIWIDWTSRQTSDIRETFLAGESGLYNVGIFYMKQYMIMYHHAKPGNSIPGDNIRDNGGLSASLGMNLNNFIPLDSCSFSIGSVLSYDRIRGIYDLEFPFGILCELDLKYKKIGLSGKYYNGEGHKVLYGDGLYKAKSYGRIDIYYYPFYSKDINSKFGFSFHFIDGEINYSQAIIIQIGAKGEKKINTF